MEKEALRQQFENLLRNPSDEAMHQFFSAVRCEVHGIPACPNCSSGHTVKMGFNKRKHGAEQQFRCNSCRHIYTKTSIKTNELRKKYPKCEKCGSSVKRSGFWKWKTANGRRKIHQRYECTNKECGHFFSLESQEVIKT